MNTPSELFPTWADKDAIAIADDVARIGQSYNSAVYMLRRSQLAPYFSNQQQLLVIQFEQAGEGAARIALLAVWENLLAQFGKYLDVRLPLPKPVLARERERNEAAFAPLATQLAEGGVGKALIDILGSAFSFENLPNGDDVPLAKLRYLHKLLPLLAGCIKKQRKAGDRPLENHVIRLLILQNFNSVEFLIHCAAQIDGWVSADLPLMEQLRGYDALLVEFSACKQLRNQAFVAGLPGIRADIDRCIRTRVRALRNALGQLEDLKGAGLLPVQAEWTLSAAQLALFLRVLVDRKVLIPQEDKRFFEFVTSHVRTPKAEHPSPKAFGNNFYNYPSHGDALKVYRLLTELAETVKVEYGVAV